MRLAAKIVFAFLASSLVLLALDGWFLLRNERQRVQQDAEADARLLGRALKTVVEDLWGVVPDEELLQLLEDVDEDRPLFSIRWLRPPADESTDLDLPATIATALRDGREISLRGRRDTLRTYVPIDLPESATSVLELTEDLAPLRDVQRRSLTRLALLGGGAALLAMLFVATVGVRFVGRPLDRLVDKTRRVGRDDFSVPLVLKGRDELAELATSINTMCCRLAESRRRLEEETEARIAALDQLRHEDRLRTVGRLASGVAHELGTPLNVVQGRAGLIRSLQLTESEIVENAKIIESQTRSMTNIVQQLLDFARRRARRKSPVQIGTLIPEAVDLMRPISKKGGAVIRTEIEPDLPPAWAHAAQLQQVVVNLLMNSLQAESRTVEVSVRTVRTAPPEGVGGEPGIYLCLSISDDGHGIDAGNLAHVFEPFFTTKDVGQGTGLGLAIAHGIVREHGGWIQVESVEGQGASFSIFLPTGESG